MLRFTFLFSLSLLVTQACLATELAGDLSGTLTPAGNPYLVVSHIDVQAGDTLRIEAGCDLRFLAGTSLDIYGALRVMGNPGIMEVSFTADTATAWDGIDMYDGSDSELQGFILNGAATGLHIFGGRALLEDGDIGPSDRNGLRIESDDVIVRRLLCHDSLTESYTPLFIHQASPLLENCRVFDCGGAAGVGIWGPAAPTLRECEVSNCLSGITCVASSPIIDRAWIHDNGIAGDFNSGAGIYVGYAGGEPLVTNSMIEGNCFGVSVMLDGSVNLGDLVNDYPGDDGLNRFRANDLYDGRNRHLWNGTQNVLLAQNNYWAGSDGVYVETVPLIDTWIIDDEEGEGAAVDFEPLAVITAIAENLAASTWSCHPNPANPVFTLDGHIPLAGRLRISLFTPGGRLAATLMDGDVAAGSFSHTFSVGDLPSSLYLVRIAVNGEPHALSRLVILR
ncbi:MAG: hypothetical protein GY835_07725 [bacterium]|nr:hypothetical protein [bacterium]